MREQAIQRDRQRLALQQGPFEGATVLCGLRIPGVCAGNDGARNVHHVHGVNAGRYDLDNLITTCWPCNRRVGDPTQGAEPESPVPPWLAALMDEEAP